MKYMLLLRGEDKFLQLSPAEQQRVVEAYNGWAGQLASEDRIVDADHLQTTGVVLTSENGVVTDGPFVESKDMAGGYFIIRADSLDHAVELARNAPTFSYGGSVEVRPAGMEE